MTTSNERTARVTRKMIEQAATHFDGHLASISRLVLAADDADEKSQHQEARRMLVVGLAQVRAAARVLSPDRDEVTVMARRSVVPVATVAELDEAS